MLQYRREIDGLRAFALLPVLIYHANPTLLPGGFIGVDIFFVISGYLITGILMREIRSGDFSLLGFYERRARRILPALICMILVSTALAWVLLSNAELVDYLKSVSGAALFYSNVVFWQGSGYFDVGAEARPLLHTWSLAVEEQFYLFFPVLLFVCWGLFKTRIWVIVLVLGAFSFALSVVLSPRFPDSSFYLLHTRFWELAIGALVAMGCSGKELEGKPWLGWFGLGLVGFSIAFIAGDRAFPGYIALFPTVGTALILIGARGTSASARFLSLRPFVAIGLISYSTYLWHQPLLVFGRRFYINGMPESNAIVLACSSVLLGYMSWRWVERPFRDRTLISRKAILSGSCVAILALFALPQWALLNEIGNDRTTAASHSTKMLASFTQPNLGLGNCSDLNMLTSGACTYGKLPNMVILGDSYAMHLVQAFQAARPDIAFTQISKSACDPVFGVAENNRKLGIDMGLECIEHNDQALKYILEGGFKNIVISATFRTLINGRKLTNRSGKVISNELGFGMIGFVELIETLKNAGRRVILVSPMPLAPYSPADCMVRSSFMGRDFESCNFPAYEDKRSRIYEILNDFSEAEDVPVVFLKDFVCVEGTCRVAIGGVPIYRDNAHLPPAGSVVLGEATDFVHQVMSKFGL